MIGLLVVGDEANRHRMTLRILNEPETLNPRLAGWRTRQTAAPVVERTATGGLLPMDDSNAAEPPRQKEREPTTEPIAGGLLAASGPK